MAYYNGILLLLAKGMPANTYFHYKGLVMYKLTKQERGAMRKCSAVHGKCNEWLSTRGIYVGARQTVPVLNIVIKHVREFGGFYKPCYLPKSARAVALFAKYIKA